MAQNCHRMIPNKFLDSRYRAHLNELQRVRSGVLQPIFLLTHLVQNSLKVVWQHDEPPGLPEGCDIPAEDVDVVRAALVSHPVFVTAEAGLRDAINRCEALHLRAVSPGDALVIARET